MSMKACIYKCYSVLVPTEKGHWLLGQFKFSFEVVTYGAQLTVVFRRCSDSEQCAAYSLGAPVLYFNKKMGL